MHNEEIFTPKATVELMLDTVGYTDDCNNLEESPIIKKHILDNSCGKGAFLLVAVERYVNTALIYGLDRTEICSDLGQYFHGIDINNAFVVETIIRLQDLVRELLGNDCPMVIWDINAADNLLSSLYDGKMDYIVGNPPYCKIHDIANRDIYSDYQFIKGGMTDIYLAFCEKSFKQLAWNGKLCYITPSSWLTSKAGRMMRKYIVANGTLQKIIQCGHTPMFKGVTTFTVISVFCEGAIRRNDFQWRTINSDQWHTTDLLPIPFDDRFFLLEDDEKNMFEQMSQEPLSRKVLVKNGFATLNDKFFLVDSDTVVPDHCIPVVKASTGKHNGQMFYPYDKNNKLLAQEDLTGIDVAYMEIHREASKKPIDVNNINWYQFGRTQAIKDTYKDKVTIQSLIKDDKDVVCTKAPTGTGVYGGLYMVVADQEDRMTEDLMNGAVEAIQSEDFKKYVSLLGHYKNGGYYTFTSDEAERFVNNWLHQRSNLHQTIYE